MQKTRPLVGVSGCLLGNEIRYDGQHKRHPYIVDELSSYFEYQSFCPEMAMGLGVPRATIHLLEKKGILSLVDTKDPKIDHTKNAYHTYKNEINALKECSGIILTKGSPSCGHDKVKVYSEKGQGPSSKSMGLWAKYLEEHLPLIPKIDSGRLYDNHLRDLFRTKVLVYHDWKEHVLSPASLINFHERNKFFLLQFGDKDLKFLGRTCSNVSTKNFLEKKNIYQERLFIETFRQNVTVKKRTNVIEHMAGYFKNTLGPSDKRYLHDHLKAYLQEKISFEVLIVLIGFLANTYNENYLQQQSLLKFYRKG